MLLIATACGDDNSSDVPTSTPDPTPSRPRPSGLGIRNNPFRFGASSALNDDWEISTVGLARNGDWIVAASSELNDPPAVGNQFFVVTVVATYLGEGSAPFEARFGAVGSTNTEYTPDENSCGILHEAIPDNEVSSGGTVSGDVCWEIASTDADGLLMYYDRASLDGTERIYWGFD